jgi:hypothetical protein
MYFHQKKTKKYLSILSKLVDDYNNTVHSVTKQTPFNIYFKDKKPFQSNNFIAATEPKYKVNDYVRISYKKGIFEKGYTQNWSNEVYKIYNVDNSEFPTIYNIEDLKGENIDGLFYEQELLKTAIPDYKEIDEVTIEKEGRKNVYIVSYKGLPSKFNERLYKKEYDLLVNPKEVKDNVIKETNKEVVEPTTTRYNLRKRN